MSKNIFLSIFIITISQLLFAQKQVPFLKANAPTLSIKDGDEFLQDYWTVSPDIKLDVYQANKTRETKNITFYSDVDSISFVLKPLDKIDFIVLLNEKDTCRQRIQSGITFRRTADMIQQSDTIHFSLTKANNISIPALINDTDSVHLMFHTAANSITITEEATKKMSGINFDKKFNGVQSWGGTNESARVADNNKLSIGNFHWDKLSISENKNSGPGTDGKFGPNLFHDKVLEVDFENNRLIIHSLPPAIGPEYERHNLIFQGENMFIEGTCKVGEEEINNRFLIHSGYSGALLFDDEFTAKNNFGEILQTNSESELRDSYGNVLKTKNATLPQFKIGDVAFDQLPVTFFEGAIGRQKMSVMGGNLLKRFNIIIDLQNAYIYLKPNELFELAYTE